MSYYAKEQLKKVISVDIPDFGDSDKIIIKKRKPTSADLMVENHAYVISIDDAVLTPNDSSNLQGNWNNGTLPKHKTMKVSVDRIMNRMIKVTGIGYDPTTNTDIADVWEGWLPDKSITILGEI